MFATWFEDGGRAAIVEEGRSVSFADLAARAQALAIEMRRRADPSGSHFALCFRTDRAAFLAALFASWIDAREVWLCDPGRRDTVAGPAFHPRTALYVHDSDAGRGIAVRGWSARASDDTALPTDTVPALTAIVGEPWTLADAGAPREAIAGAHAVRLDSAALAAELRAGLDACADVARGAWMSTLPPSHGPAALAAALLPLAHGAHVVAATPRIADVARDVATDVLVVGAGQLAALHAVPRGSLGAVRVVLAAGDPFDARLAAAVGARHAVDVRAVFSSCAVTEAESALVRELLASEGARDAAAVEVGGVTYGLVAGAQDARRRPFVRTCARIPRMPSGALDRALLLAHFGARADGAPRDLDVERGARVRLPEGTDWTRGHFDRHLLLAGAAQITELVLPALAAALGRPAVITAAPALKFSAPIRPGDEVDVVVDVAPDARTAAFRIVRGAATCASGRLVLEATTP